MTDNERTTFSSRALTAGADAASPIAIPLAGWHDLVWRAWANCSKHDLNILAAAVAFFAFVSFVPTLAMLVMIYGLIADPAEVAQHMRLIIDAVPADAARLINNQLTDLTESAPYKGSLGLVIAGVVSLYGASRASYAMIRALNVIYEQEDRRSFVRGSLMAFALAAAAVVVAIAGILAASTLSWAGTFADKEGTVVTAFIQLMTWIVAASLCSLALAAMYRFAPYRSNARWRWLSLGAVLATVIWLVATVGFGIFAANFPQYGATYGSLGAVVVLMMWLYLSAYAVLVGALINAEIERQTAVDTTTGPIHPIGERGAAMADASAALDL